MNKTRKFSLLLLISALVSMGCTVSEVITAESTDLDVASLDISENLLLDVGIMNFDAGVPAKNNSEKSGIYPEVRMAEARYIPYHMKKTLQGTGFWGGCASHTESICIHRRDRHRENSTLGWRVRVVGRYG